jgi:putative nucleotidyltransferase with HDIG domain
VASDGKERKGMTPDLTEISARLKKYAALPVASSVVREVFRSLESQTASFEETAIGIERDPDLALQILRSANSLTSSFTGRVHSVLQAVRLLGFKTIRGLLLSSVLLDRAKGHAGIPELWSHSQMVSLNAKIVARRLQVPWEEEAQTAGLLHDVGKVFFYEEFPEYYQEAFQLGDSKQAEPDWKRERAVFGVDHSFVGNRLLQAFGIPRVLSDPVLFLHDPPADLLFPELTNVLIVADQMATAMGFGSPEFDFVEEILMGALDRLGLGDADLREFLSEAHSRSPMLEILSL